MKRKLEDLEETPRYEQDVATFTHGKRGTPPYFPGCIIPESGMFGNVAGQDYTRLIFPSDDAQNLIVTMCDGHGAFGHFYAVHAGEYLAGRASNLWDSIREFAGSPQGFEDAASAPRDHP